MVESSSASAAVPDLGLGLASAVAFDAPTSSSLGLLLRRGRHFRPGERKQLARGCVYSFHSLALGVTPGDTAPALAQLHERRMDTLQRRLRGGGDDDAAERRETMGIPAEGGERH